VSDSNDPNLTPPDAEASDEAVREYGRQLATDSILHAALSGTDATASTEPVRGTTTTQPARGPFPFWKVGSVAAALLVAIGGLWFVKRWTTDYQMDNAQEVQDQQYYDGSKSGWPGGSAAPIQTERHYKHRPQDSDRNRSPEPRPRNNSIDDKASKQLNNSGSHRIVPVPPHWDEIEPPQRRIYQQIYTSRFQRADRTPLSTFSIDVDTASYSLVRRSILEQRRMPSPAEVRIEELLNYFKYHDPAPIGNEPISVNVEIASAPWRPSNRLIRIGLRGRPVAENQRPPTNLVFLLDVSGSMRAADKLPLLKRALMRMVDGLDADDRVAIVTYAGAAGLALPSTPVSKRHQILQALNNLHAGGSTNGGEGIQLAYRVASQHFIRGGNNRVILASDGDFNVGVTRRGDLHRLIADKRRTGVFLSVLGFGTGNYRDQNMETLADKGNGHYHYIDSDREAYRVLVEQISGTLTTVAKDVKLQVEFNPAVVHAYRLIGYENRRLAARDFNDDRKDAGEIGADHAVVALYEVIPTGHAEVAPIGHTPSVDALRYRRTTGWDRNRDQWIGADRSERARDSKTSVPVRAGREMLHVKWRFKRPHAQRSERRSLAIVDRGQRFAHASSDFHFTAAVAAFGQILRGEGGGMSLSLGEIAGIAQNTAHAETDERRSEFLRIVRTAQSLRR
jgi:Ca-activated chloride channel family protein